MARFKRQVRKKRQKKIVIPKKRKVRKGWTRVKFEVYQTPKKRGRGLKWEMRPRKKKAIYPLVEGFGNVKVYVHNEATDSKPYFPYIYGYKPRGWNWIKSNYELHLIILYIGGNYNTTPPKEVRVIRHRNLKYFEVVAGGKRENLSKQIEGNLNQRLEGWKKQEERRMKSVFESMGVELDEFKFVILSMKIFRMGASKKELSLIEPLARYSIKEVHKLSNYKSFLTPYSPVNVRADKFMTLGDYE